VSSCTLPDPARVWFLSAPARGRRKSGVVDLALIERPWSLLTDSAPTAADRRTPSASWFDRLLPRVWTQIWASPALIGPDLLSAARLVFFLESVFNFEKLC
jgi:hypothetical protein